MFFVEFHRELLPCRSRGEVRKIIHAIVNGGVNVKEINWGRFLDPRRRKGNIPL